MTAQLWFLASDYDISGDNWTGRLSNFLVNCQNTRAVEDWTPDLALSVDFRGLE